MTEQTKDFGQSKIKKLESTIRSRDRQIEKLQKELELAQKHLDRVKNDLLPPIYREIKNVGEQRDVARAEVTIIQAWVRAVLLCVGLEKIHIPDDTMNSAIHSFKLRAEKTRDGIDLWTVYEPTDGTTQDETPKEDKAREV